MFCMSRMHSQNECGPNTNGPNQSSLNARLRRRARPDRTARQAAYHVGQLRQIDEEISREVDAMIADGEQFRQQSQLS